MSAYGRILPHGMDVSGQVPETLPLANALQQHPGFRDMVVEASEKGLFRLEAEFLPLLDDQQCPRCHARNSLRLSQVWNLGTHVRY